MLTRFRAAGLVWPTLATLLALAMLMGLGVWQWQRMAWKTALAAQIEARAKDAPLAQRQALGLSCDAPAGQMSTRCEYVRVRLEGRFEHAGERHVFAGVHSVDRRSGVGYWIFTPFVPVGSQRPIYVNRGFVPDALKAPATRPDSLPEGEVTIVAQVRTREVRGRFDGENDRQKNMFFVRDPREFAVVGAPIALPDSGGIASVPFYLEVIAAPGQTGFPRPLAGTIAIPNRHFEYALTWWGLALTLIGVYGSFAWARLRVIR